MQVQLGTEVIPTITEPEGKYWDQPGREQLIFCGGYVYMTRKTYMQLKIYNSSTPSGVYEGKMWKGHVKYEDVGRVAWLRWFGHSSIRGKVTNNQKIIVIVKERAMNDYLDKADLSPTSNTPYDSTT